MNKNVSPAPNSLLVRGSKGIVHLFLLIIIVVLVIGGLIYYSWQKGLIKTNIKQEVPPTPTRTENTEHFVDDQKLISFDYPKGSTSINSVSPSPIGGVTFQASFGEWLKDPDSWTIGVLSIPLYENAEKTKQDIFDTSDLIVSETSKYTEILETTLGGQKAIHQRRELKLSPDTKIVTLTTETVYNNTYYSVGVSFLDKTNQELVSQAPTAYNLIRRTFMFIQ